MVFSLELHQNGAVLVVQHTITFLVNSDISDICGIFVASDQSSREEIFPATQTPLSPAVLVIEEIAKFLNTITMKTGAGMTN